MAEFKNVSLAIPKAHGDSEVCPYIHSIESGRFDSDVVHPLVCFFGGHSIFSCESVYKFAPTNCYLHDIPQPYHHKYQGTLALSSLGVSSGLLTFLPALGPTVEDCVVPFFDSARFFLEEQHDRARLELCLEISACIHMLFWDVEFYMPS